MNRPLLQPEVPLPPLLPLLPPLAPLGPWGLTKEQLDEINALHAEKASEPRPLSKRHRQAREAREQEETADPDPGCLTAAGDPYEVWRRFDQGAGVNDSDPKNRFATIGSCQKAFFEASGIPCTRVGHVVKKRDDDDGNDSEAASRRLKKCHHPLCPSCWIRRMGELGTMIARVQAPWWHLRATHWAEYPPRKADEAAPPLTGLFLKHFHTETLPSKARLVCWTYQFQFSEDVEERAPGATEDRWFERLDYRLVGLWVSQTKLRRKERYRLGVVRNAADNCFARDDGRYLGQLDIFSSDYKQEIIDHWTEHTPFFDFRKATCYKELLNHVNHVKNHPTDGFKRCYQTGLINRLTDFVDPTLPKIGS